MKIDIVTPEPVVPPKEVVITLTENEARTLLTIVGRTTGNDTDSLFTNCADGHVEDFMYKLYDMLDDKGLTAYATNGKILRSSDIRG